MVFYPCLEYLASRIGSNLLKVDTRTRVGKHPIEARICVALDGTMTPPSRIWIGWGNRSFFQEIIYEDSSVCAYCKTRDHTIGDCPRLAKKKQSKELVTVLTSSPRRRRGNKGKEVASFF